MNNYEKDGFAVGALLGPLFTVWLFWLGGFDFERGDTAVVCAILTLLSVFAGGLTGSLIGFLVGSRRQYKTELDKIAALNVPNLLRSLVHEDLIDNGDQVNEVADELQAILGKR